VARSRSREKTYEKVEEQRKVLPIAPSGWMSAMASLEGDVPFLRDIREKAIKSPGKRNKSAEWSIRYSENRKWGKQKEARTASGLT